MKIFIICNLNFIPTVFGFSDLIFPLILENALSCIFFKVPLLSSSLIHSIPSNLSLGFYLTPSLSATILMSSFILLIIHIPTLSQWHIKADRFFMTVLLNSSLDAFDQHSPISFTSLLTLLNIILYSTSSPTENFTGYPQNAVFHKQRLVQAQLLFFFWFFFPLIVHTNVFILFFYFILLQY